MVVLLGALSVASIREDDGPYGLAVLMQPGLRFGVVVAMGLLLAPVCVLVVQCARIGAPARDRRLAAYRLSGLTPTEVRRVASVETSLTTGLGSLVGAGTFFAARAALNGPTTVVGTYERERALANDDFLVQTVRGRVHLLPTDVDVSWWLVALAILALPALVGGFSLVALRRVIVSPFGVARRATVTTPRWAPALAFATGTVLLMGFSTFQHLVGAAAGGAGPVVVGFVCLCGLLISGGLVWGSAAMAVAIGGAVAARTHRASLLIAGRRLVASPFTASRVNALVLVVLLIGGFVLGFGAWLTMWAPPEENDFYASTMTLVYAAVGVGAALAVVGILITTGETIVSARRTLAALVATGVPRRVLRRAHFLEAMLPLLATAPVAVVTGVLVTRGLFGTQDQESLGTVAHERLVTVQVEVPWVPMLWLTGGVLAMAGVMAWLALTFVRSSTDPRELRTSA